MPRSYKVTIRWRHRKYGPQSHIRHQHATSIRRAMNAAVHTFFSEPAIPKDERKKLQSHRRDAHEWLQVEAWRVPQ